MAAPSLYSTCTDLSADSIESHPLISGLFALGTYQVDQLEDQHQLSTDDTDQLENQGDQTSPPYQRRGRITLRKIRKLDQEEQQEKEKGKEKGNEKENVKSHANTDLHRLSNDNINNNTHNINTHTHENTHKNTNTAQESVKLEW